MPRLYLLLSLATSSQALAKAPAVVIRPFVEVQKPGVLIGPSGATAGRIQQALLGPAKVASYEPNEAPSAGLSLSYGSLGVSYSKSFTQSRGEVQQRGKSTTTYYEVHKYGELFGFDASWGHSKGFFQRTLNLGDARPFQDSLFDTRQSYPVFADMQVTVAHLTAFAELPFSSLSLANALDLSGGQLKSGWAPLVMLSLTHSAISSSTPLVLAAQMSAYGSDGGLTGGTFDEAALLPGLAFVLATGNWFISPVGFCGPALQNQNFNGISRIKYRMRGSVCDLRGTAGYHGQHVTFGLLGYKDIHTTSAETIDLTWTASTVQMFLSIPI